jgi:hypothetical protein
VEIFFSRILNFFLIFALFPGVKNKIFFLKHQLKTWITIPINSLHPKFDSFPLCHAKMSSSEAQMCAMLELADPTSVKTFSPTQ